MYYIILLLMALAGMGFCLYILRRNEQVFKYRGRLIDTIYSFKSDDYMWRRDIYMSVSYGDMVWKFWKPLDDFYPNKSFLLPVKKEVTHDTRTDSSKK